MLDLATFSFGLGQRFVVALVLDKLGPGSQAGTSSKIENYMGFPTGLSGADLANRAVLQAEKFGATLTAPAEVVQLVSENGYHVLRLESGDEVTAKCVLICTGALYITTGDAPTRELAQQLTLLAGKTLRLNDDGTGPSDNPFVTQRGARPEIWSYGHRNAPCSIAAPLFRSFAATASSENLRGACIIRVVPDGRRVLRQERLLEERTGVFAISPKIPPVFSGSCPCNETAPYSRMEDACSQRHRSLLRNLQNPERQEWQDVRRS